MVYEIQETAKFRSDLEEALLWLYSHNLEQSQEFADKKFVELEAEILNLKTHLMETPRMGQTDKNSELRRFPVYDGRYIVTWLIDDKVKIVTLLQFLDSKYPTSLRQFHFDE